VTMMSQKLQNYSCEKEE